MIEHIVWLCSTILVIAIVSVHYEVMLIVSDRVIPWAEKHVHNRRVMAFAIAGLMIGHIAEIWIFAFVTMVLVQFPILGSVQGDFNNTWEDFLYLSSVNYTSLGDSNTRLVGPIRALTASETLSGLLMVAWSASFTYLKMENIWRRHRRKPRT